MFFRRRKFVKRRAPYGRRKRFVKRRKLTTSRRGYPSRRAAAPYMPVIPALSLPGVPQRCIARMRWCTQWNNPSNADGKTVAATSYRANSPVDVASGGTRDAFGWAQLNAIYNRAVVKGSKARLQVVPAASLTGFTVPMVYGIGVSDSVGGTYTDYRDYIERRQGQWVLNQVQEPYKKTIMSRWSARKWFTAPSQYANVLVGGVQPVDVVWYIVWAQPYNRNVALSADILTGVMTIDFIVEFSEPKDIVASP